MLRLLSRAVPANRVVRLILTTSALITLACAMLSVVLVRQHVFEIHRSLAERGNAISHFLAREGELGVISGDAEELGKLAMVAHEQRDVVYCRFFDAEDVLLASVGPVVAGIPSSVAKSEIETVLIREDPDVMEFWAPVLTTSVQLQREELGFLEDPGAASGNLPPGAGGEHVGKVVIGMNLRPLRAERLWAMGTAAGFTVLVAVLAVVGAALLTGRPLQALAEGARLAEEREKIAEMKARFVTNASHEFRTPLAVILAASDVLKRYAPQMTIEEQQGRLRKIQTSVKQMTELLDDVLTVGRSEAGRLSCVRERLDVEAFCREILVDVQTTALETHRLVLSCRRVGREVNLDPKLMRQALRNLLTNAVKYSPEGGKVELEVDLCDGELLLRIRDQGIGIDPEDQEHLFEAFQRGKNVGKIPGSGLGLMIAQAAVERHQGTITLERTGTGGTSFLITLPCDPAAASTALGEKSSAGGENS